MTARFITAEEITDSFSFLSAVDAIQEALLGGLDPAGDLPRSILPIEKGELLLMPSTSVEGSGIKVLTIAPNNPALNEPRIQGIYLLFDKENLSISSILDGAALTTYRTPAISFAAVRKGLELSRGEISLVVFGSGPQAISHIQTLAALDVKVTSVVFVVRDIEKAQKRIPDVAQMGLTSECTIHILGADSHEVNQHLQQADLVIAATTARAPLFDSTHLKQSVIVIAVGSHEPDVREIDSKLVARAQVVVETRASALREAGDVIMAIGDGSITAQSLHELADVVCGRTTLNREQPIFFKSSGMSWEDLVIARAVERDCRTTSTTS
jgi:ornithine cyclodeaminase